MMYFIYDTDNYFIGNADCETQPEHSTTVVPLLDADYYSRFNGTEWVNEKKPTCADDLNDITVPDISDETVDASNHEKELYALFNQYLDDKHHIVVNVSDKTVTFKAYTPEEIAQQEQAKEDEAAKAELEADIAAIREDMMTAIAINDDEWLEELRAEYEELVNGGEN